MLGFSSSPQWAQDTMLGNLRRFPALKRFFPITYGSGTFEAECAVSGTKLISMPWTATSAHSGYMNVASESDYPVGHHNVDLAAGTWPQVGRNSSIWMLGGKFDGIFSFGFGDSTPNNKEIVFAADATPNPLVLAKFNASQSISIPNIGAGVPFPGSLSSTVTCLVGLIINEDDQNFEFFIVDGNGDYISVTTPISDYSNYAGCDLPATYSMGRDVVTSSLSGIVDLSAIAVFEFETMPNDIHIAMEWMRTEWAVGRKVIWPGWKGVT